MTPEELKERLTVFGANVVVFCCELRRKPEARQIADQLSDSGTSISSNYRAACRARSHREFIARIAVAVEEADESVGWLEIVMRARLADGSEPHGLLKEAKELVAILGASRSTAEDRRRHRRD